MCLLFLSPSKLGDGSCLLKWDSEEETRAVSRVSRSMKGTIAQLVFIK